MLTIARLTAQEAARRRLVLALVILTALVIAVTAWGFSRIPTLADRGGTIPEVQVKLIASQLLIMVMFMFSQVLALSAVFMASPSVSGEVESGIALSVLARPIKRWEYMVGKWLGLAALVGLYALVAVLAEFAVVQAVVGYMPPEPGHVVVFLIAEGIACLTLALALSTRLSGMVGGVIALVLLGMVWLGGIVGGMGVVFANEAITRIGTVSRIIFPTDLLWRASVWSLEPAAARAAAANAGPAALATPFFAAAPPETAWLIWAFFWIVGMLGLAIWSFNRREI